MDAKPSEDQKRSPVHRSPSYPSITLAKAIDRARVFYQHERRNSANVAVALGHWGYAASSGGGRTLLAAMLAFGLMRDEGAGEKRQVKLTDLAFRIILDDRIDSPDRDAALREAALTPKIYREILADFPRLEVSDANLKHHLLVHRKFNDNAVKDFISDLRSTVSFAKLDVSPDSSVDPAASAGSTINVGDYVRWESNGVIQFESRRVSWVKEGFAGVDGSNTGIPISELVVVQAPILTPSPSAPPAPTLAPKGYQPANAAHVLQQKGVGMRQEVFALAEGDVTIQWPERLSPESLEDFIDWLRILERKIKRNVIAPRQPHTDMSGDVSDLT